MLSEWYATWYIHIRPVLVPGRLRLNFVCDVADVETGRIATAPFLEVPASQQLLAGCSVRLSRRANPDLNSLARRAVLRATTGQLAERHESGSFRFMDLPAELRIRVLAYTDLVTPFREVEWNASHGMYRRYRFTGRLDDMCPNVIHGVTTLHDHMDFYGDNPIPTCWEFSYPAGCYCGAFHAAYSSVYPCKCWSQPTPLFLVSRQVRQDALRVFFGYNRVIVAPSTGDTWIPANSPDRLPVSIFLTEIIPRDALQFLRYLEIVFPPIGESWTYCPPNSAEWHDWIQTLETVKDKLSLSRLTIRLYFAYFKAEPGWLRLPKYRERIGSTERQEGKRSYMNTIAPLRKLDGLRRFFANLSDPISYSELSHEWWMAPWEEEAEHLVMGQEYDAAAAGKAEQTTSQWLEDHAMYGSLD